MMDREARLGVKRTSVRMGGERMGGRGKETEEKGDGPE